jgi:hypothetical protein
MKHSLDELLGIAYRYYPRETVATDAGKETEEHTRLVVARRQAARDERWHSMLKRISQQFPNAVTNRSLHLPTGEFDACYSFTVCLSEATAYPTLWFRVSFLAPYYIVYSYRSTDVIAEPEGFNVLFCGMLFYIPRRAVGTDLSSPDNEIMRRAVMQRTEIVFDLTSDERTVALPISRDIESTFGCEPMPPEVGAVLVPGVTTNARALGKTRLYDCFFSDSHQWVKDLPSEERVRVEIDANLLPRPFVPVLTVLAAFYYIGLSLAGTDTQSAYFRASTDGVLRKEELLQALSRMELLVESPTTVRALAAARQLETLIAEWNGEGAPSDAMVAWAQSVLADWIAIEGAEGAP